MNSLKAKLLTLLVSALTLLFCGELWLSYDELIVAANSAYDRSLAGAIKTIDGNISNASGSLGMVLPYPILEAFQLAANGEVFYRVTTEDRLVTMGNADLPEPPVNLQPGVPYFYNAQYFGKPIRIGAYTRMLEKPLYGVKPQRVMIQVGETTESRAIFARGLIQQAMLLDALLVLAIAVVMSVGVVLALRPLHRLRREVMSRLPNDLTPIDSSRVPLEVRPLVDAINEHIDRSERMAKSQRQFLDDASHQLRTPLAVLRTQVDYAMREPELSSVREALGAMQRGVDRAARLVNQLLALSRANNTATLIEASEKIDLNTIAEEVARMLLPEARRKVQDFGFVGAEHPIVVHGMETMLREAIANLVDNAIRYVPEGGHITLTVNGTDTSAQIAIADNGPGMSSEERARVGERFRRGKTAPVGGAGLGLAIAKTIIEQHGGKLEIDDGPDQEGITMRLILPREQAA